MGSTQGPLADALAGKHATRAPHHVVEDLAAQRDVVTTRISEGPHGGDVVKRVAWDGLTDGERERLEDAVTRLAGAESAWLVCPSAIVEDALGMEILRPFVPGTPLGERLSSGPLPLRDGFMVSRCIMLALEELHARGVLHGNLKPSNVILVDGPDGIRARVVDPGLSFGHWAADASRAWPIEEAQYLSPDQAGALDRSVDERSDLYSAGLLVFACLAGRPPFQGASAGELLRQHVTARPPELASLGVSVPRGLDDVVQRLLRKDPSDR
jgi:serine/threonine protein kinase